MKFGLILAAIACAAGAAPAANEQVYTGSCDGSAIAMIGSDRFVTVSDEDPVLRTYPIGGGSDVPSRRVDLRSSLDLHPDEEGDFEAAARIGDTIYWIASFGSGKHGGEEKSRRRFFGTKVSLDGRLTVLGNARSRSDTTLFDVLTRDPRLAGYKLAEGALLPPKSANALNIESLAANGHGGLLIGFRNPLAGNGAKAIVITLANPAQVVAGTQKPILLGVTEIKLGGRGVRDMIFRPQRNDYLIVAGAIDETRDFAIYRWTGIATDEPTKLSVDLGSLNPEALAVFNDGHLLLLSDDGEQAAPDGDKTCKKLPLAQRHFRAMIRPSLD